MEKRIAQEFELIKRVYSRAVRQDRWVWVPDYLLPTDWNLKTANVAFFVRDGFPGTGPYGVYVPSGLRHNGNVPNNFTDPAPTQPPFDGAWAIFSWEAIDWKPAADPERGHNLLNFVQGFSVRFREGV